MNTHSQLATDLLEDEADKAIDRTQGAGHRNNGYMQPLHHHSYQATFKRGASSKASKGYLRRIK